MDRNLLPRVVISLMMIRLGETFNRFRVECLLVLLVLLFGDSEEEAIAIRLAAGEVFVDVGGRIRFEGDV